jgi:hydroxyacylglutathione hydrolase
VPLTIRPFPAGPIATNAYLVSDDATSDALIIDAPPDVTEAITAEAQRAGLNLTRIVITHGHWDHIGDAARLHEVTGAPLVGLAGLDATLKSPTTTAQVQIPPSALDATVADGDLLQLGETVFSVMHLPGHETDHIVLYDEADRVVLGGDVLFPGGHGRTDIPGSDQAVMDRSLARLAALPDDVTVWPGHGDATTIGAERGWLPAPDTDATGA